MFQEDDFSAMSLDELWRAHQMISQLLVMRLTARHRQLDEKLAILRRPSFVAAAGADHPIWTKASGRAAVSQPVKKQGNGAAKHMALEKAEN